jgi:hypothetical protein
MLTDAQVRSLKPGKKHYKSFDFIATQRRNSLLPWTVCFRSRAPSGAGVPPWPARRATDEWIQGEVRCVSGSWEAQVTTARRPQPSALSPSPSRSSIG